MDLNVVLAIGWAVTVLLLILTFRFWRSSAADLRSAVSNTRSLSTKYGQMSEQFMPFVSAYPWDPQRFRFIGSPIDGVQFEEDRVILIEFKTATSKLSARQRQIRDQVQGGRVEFQEFRLE